MIDPFTPNLLQKWLLLPEWAIGSVAGILVAALAGYLFIGRREQALFLALRMSRLFGRKGAR